MRIFDYSKLKERTWDNEILAYVAQIVKRNRRHDDSSGDYRRGSVFLPDSESDFDQQYICTGDYYRTLCTIACVNGYDDPECGLIADRICNLRERIWGEDGIYEYLAASVSGGI